MDTHEFDEMNEAAIKGEEHMTAAEASALREMVEDFSDRFYELCQARHDEGAEKYGATTWMTNDVVRMMIEELADTANYCRYQAIKLMMMQSYLEAELVDTFDSDEEGNVTIGMQAFKGTKDAGWRK